MQMWTYESYSDRLKHHGILGMRWGIRRYQNIDGTLTPAGRKRYEKGMGENRYIKPVYTNDYGEVRLKKGSIVSRVSSKQNETESGRTYVSFKRLDHMKYISEAGEDGLYWMSNGDNYGYDVRLKVTNDIIAPSYKDSIDAFINSVKDVPIDELAKRVYGTSKGTDSIYDQIDYMRKTEAFINDMGNLTIPEARSRAYKRFSASLMSSDENRKAFFDELKRNGYNAVIDENDVGFTEAPLIIFEKSNNLKQISANPITVKDKDAALTELYKNGAY